MVVQQLVDADRAGVMFSADPSTGDRERIVIEGAFGLGEVVVGGEVEPDTYIMAKDGPRLLEVRIGRKDHKVVRGANGVIRVDLSAGEAMDRVLSDAEALELARLALGWRPTITASHRTSSGPSRAMSCPSSRPDRSRP